MPNAFGYEDEEDLPDEMDLSDEGPGPFGHLPARPDDELPPADASGSEDETGSPAQAPTPTPADPQQQPTADQPGTTPAADGTAVDAGQAAPSAPDSEAGAGAGDEQTPSGEPLLAGRFRTPEELERGYENLRSLRDRDAGRMREVENEMARMRAALDQATAVRQTPPSQPLPPLDPRIVAAAQERGLDPEALPLIQHLAASEAARLADGMRAELDVRTQEQNQRFAQEQAMRESQATLNEFRSAHPEVAPGGPLDAAVSDVIEGLDLLFNRDTLEIGLEAASNPALFHVLRAEPHLIDSDEGMQIARQRATALNGGATPAAAQAAAPAPASAAPARQPHVESGGSGTPPDNGEVDEWPVVTLMKRENKRTSSALGI